MNRIVITRLNIKDKNFIVFLELNEDNSIVNLELYNDDNPSVLNCIYAGRVENIVKNINSAFVRINPNQNCYLSLKDKASYIYSKKNSKKNELCIGDEILVQVIKDAVKTKDPVVSGKLTLYGKYCILTTENTTMAISKKIPKDRADFLREYIASNYPSNIEEGFGILIRTNGANVSEDELRSDINALYNTYTSIKQNASHYSLYSNVYTGQKDYFLKLNSVRTENISEVITDQVDIYKELNSFYNDSDIIKTKLTLYNDSLSLNALYSIKSNLDKLTSQKVWLKSGANIIIEQLETLTVVDVNTAKNSIKNSDMLLINKEAAYEIIHQLRLRNISGMIIIDFINMKTEEEQNSLITYIKDLIRSDDKTCTYIDITKLGLIELTRKKTSRSLLEQLNS